MTKKDFKHLANICCQIEDPTSRAILVSLCCSFCKGSNPRFDEDKFREWIRRTLANETLTGLR